MLYHFSSVLFLSVHPFCCLFLGFSLVFILYFCTPSKSWTFPFHLHFKWTVVCLNKYQYRVYIMCKYMQKMNVFVQLLQGCFARCKCSLHSMFWEKAHGCGCFVTHCEFCHPLSFAEELQAQYTPTSHGTFHSSMVKESLWMKEGVALAAAVNTVVVITGCHLFFVVSDEGVIRDISHLQWKLREQAVKPHESLFDLLLTLMQPLFVPPKLKLNIHLTTTFFLGKQMHASCYHFLVRQQQCPNVLCCALFCEIV